MHNKRALTVAASVGCLLCNPGSLVRAQPQIPESQLAVEQSATPTPSQILFMVWSESKQLPLTDRLFLLVNLVTSAAELNDSRVKSWVDQIFMETEELPNSWNRAAMRKNALIALASVDPMAAVGRLQLMEPPAKKSDGKLAAEDLAADTARRLFPVVWAKSHSLEYLEAAALAIGEKGEYPFVAMGPILVDVAKKEPGDAHRIFGTALGFFNRGNVTASTTANFVHFLKTVESSISDGYLLEAVRSVVQRIVDPRTSLFGDQSFQGSVGSVPVRNQGDHLLLQLSPMIRRLDPTLAKKLEERPELRNAPKDVSTISASTVTGDGDASAQAKAHLSNLERASIRRIRTLVGEDPDRAVVELGLVQTPELRLEALGILASGLTNSRPEMSKQCEAELVRMMKDERNGIVRLNGYLALARSAESRKDVDQLWDVIRKGFKIGEEMFRKDVDSSPIGAPFERPGFSQLLELSRIGAKADVNVALPLISELRPPTIKLHAMLMAATPNSSNLGF